MWNEDVKFKQRRPIILVDIDDTINLFAETYWALHNIVFEDNVHYHSVNQWELDLFSNRGKEAYDLFKIPGLFRNIPRKTVCERIHGFDPKNGGRICSK